MLVRGFYIFIKRASFLSPIDVGSHSPPPSGPSVIIGTHSTLQSTWDPPINHLMSTPSVFSLLTSTSASANTICNSTSSPLTDIVLVFGLSFLGFLSKLCPPLWAFVSGLPLKDFKMHLLGKGFHTLIKKYFVSLSNRHEISQTDQYR